MSNALAQFVSLFAGRASCYGVHVPEAGVHKEGEKLKAMMEEAFPGLDVYYGLIGAVISAHTGVGCLGIQYIRKVEM